MRTYGEMIAECVGRNDHSRPLWLKDLTLEEFKIFRERIDITFLKLYVPYIDDVISDKIKEIRNSKLDILFDEQKSLAQRVNEIGII